MILIGPGGGLSKAKKDQNPSNRRKGMGFRVCFGPCISHLSVGIPQASHCPSASKTQPCCRGAHEHGGPCATSPSFMATGAKTSNGSKQRL